MKILVLSALLLLVSSSSRGAAYEDRFVWLFGWHLGSDRNVQEMSRVLQSASKAGLNGVVASFGLDNLCHQGPEYFARLAVIQDVCKTNNLELIPAIFSVGYGGGALSHDRNLAEGLPVKDAPFVARKGTAVFAGDRASVFGNGGFEEFTDNKVKGLNLQDEPGRMSFVDQEMKRNGKASLRFENLTGNQHGNARAMQTIKVSPNRCYRVTFWVKTEGLRPASAFRSTVLAGGRNLAPREFGMPSTTDWRKVTYLFNSLDHGELNVYAGTWGGREGKFWLDDWTVEEVGPVNVLHRPGTPVVVRSEDGTVSFEEGRDYEPLRDSQLQPYRDDKEALALKLTSDTRVREGQRLRVSWYHSMLIHESQVTVCMGEPSLYEIFDHEAKLLAEKLKPRAVMLNMDEVRMGGTCKACEGRNMAELLGECVTRQAAALRKYNPGVRVYVWSDMFDPNHNAKEEYYLVKGSYVGSWTHIPRDLVIAVWGGEPREKSLKFFANERFQTLVACYYDADNLAEVKAWLRLAEDTPGVRGFMYTPWLKKYELLEEFGELLGRGELGSPPK